MLNILVYFGFVFFFVLIMLSVICFLGFWIDEDWLKKVLCYEWSIGESGEGLGYGIFDLKKESVWYDNGF